MAVIHLTRQNAGSLLVAMGFSRNDPGMATIHDFSVRKQEMLEERNQNWPGLIGNQVFRGQTRVVLLDAVVTCTGFARRWSLTLL